MIKFNFNCIKSHYVYENGRQVKFINVFEATKNGCFTKREAEKLIKACNSVYGVKNEIIWIY